MQGKLSALAVDDERDALLLLRQLLIETNQFSEIILANSVADGLESLKVHNHDVIFLDIDMPGADGFAMVEEMVRYQITSEIVFVTAYSHFALRALQKHAFGYILKPIVPDELNTCIQDLKRRIVEVNQPSRLTGLLKTLEMKKRIRFNTRSGFFMIEPDQVLYCQADGPYTQICTGDKSYLCSVTLGRVEEMFPQDSFFRIGRSLLINAMHLSSLEHRSQLVSFEKESKIFTLRLRQSELRELAKRM